MEEAGKLPEFLIWYAVFLLHISCHEGAHALAAHLGGDDTAYQGGQVSLNPLPHIRREPFGTVLFPILTFFMSGWVMGWASTPYDPRWGARYPRRQAAMAAAGPAANLVLAVLAFAILKGLLVTGYFVAPRLADYGHLVAPAAGGEDSFAVALALFLSVSLSLNVLLGLFNLLPIPPLDGAGIVQGLAPASIADGVHRIAFNPAFRILGLLLAWRIFGPIARWAFSVVLALLHPEFGYS